VSTPQPACPLCARLGGLEAGTDPDFIAMLEHSAVVLGDSFAWPGWCTLILREHAEHLDLLAPEHRDAVMAEAGRVGAALRAAGLASRINYECLGNVVNHIHWHVIPRRADEPEPRATVWTRPGVERERGGTDQDRRRVIERVRAALRTLPG
jgi:diadenosine tetraphosphate (Ap4A) HIT family hydrolase